MPNLSLTSPALKKCLPYLAITIGLLLLFMALSTIKPVRVGDGGEYYAMFCAWQASFHPWIDAADWQAYDTLFRSQAISAMVPTDVMQNAFPALRRPYC